MGRRGGHKRVTAELDQVCQLVDLLPLCGGHPRPLRPALPTEQRVGFLVLATRDERSHTVNEFLWRHDS